MSINGGNYESQSTIIDTQISGGNYISNDVIIDTSINGGNYESNSILIDQTISGGNYEFQPTVIDTQISGGNYISNDVIINTSINGGNYESNSVLIDQIISGGNYESHPTIINTQISGGSYQSENIVIDTVINGGIYEANPILVDLTISGGTYQSQETLIDTQIQGGEYQYESVVMDSSISGGNYEVNPVVIDTQIQGGSYESQPTTIDYSISGGNYESNSTVIDTQIQGGNYESTSVIIDSSIMGGEYIAQPTIIDTNINGGEYETGSVEIDTNLPVINSYSDSSVSPKSVSPDSDFDTGLEYSVNTLYSVQTDDGHGNITRSGWEVEPTILPTVSFHNDTSADNWITSQNGNSVSLSPNDTLTAYYWDGSGHTITQYDSTKSYAIIQWRNGSNQFAGRTQFSLFNDSDAIGIKNVSNNTYTIFQAHIAVCSDSSATVVTVYDSQNNEYNAFKYTVNGTDYYFVLDDTQEGWTDDLSSIGYSLTQFTLTAWLNSVNNTQSLPMVGDGVVYTYILYDENGNTLSISNNYTLVGYHATVDGPLLSLSGTGVYLIKDTSYGRMKITSEGTQRISIQRIEYTIL